MLEVNQPMKKRFLKTGSVCKVTFELPATAVNGGRKVALAGDFNDWDRDGTLMKRRKDGSCSITLDLPSNREYQFKYLIDGMGWENDWQADRYLPNSFGDCDHSVVIA